MKEISEATQLRMLLNFTRGQNLPNQINQTPANKRMNIQDQKIAKRLNSVKSDFRTIPQNYVKDNHIMSSQVRKDSEVQINECSILRLPFFHQKDTSGSESLASSGEKENTQRLLTSKEINRLFIESSLYELAQPVPERLIHYKASKEWRGKREILLQNIDKNLMDLKTASQVQQSLLEKIVKFNWIQKEIKVKFIYYNNQLSLHLKYKDECAAQFVYNQMVEQPHFYNMFGSNFKVHQILKVNKPAEDRIMIVVRNLNAFLEHKVKLMQKFEDNSLDAQFSAELTVKGFVYVIFFVKNIETFYKCKKSVMELYANRNNCQVKVSLFKTFQNQKLSCYKNFYQTPQSISSVIYQKNFQEYKCKFLDEYLPKQLKDSNLPNTATTTPSPLIVQQPQLPIGRKVYDESSDSERYSKDKKEKYRLYKTQYKSKYRSRSREQDQKQKKKH